MTDLTSQASYALDNHRELPCGRCEAKINDPCVTLTGDPAETPHAVRLRPLENAYLAGIAHRADST